MRKCIIITMQQQIQLERNEQERQEIERKEHIVENSEGGFEIINDDQEIIEEDINQNYQQDFDSISNESKRGDEVDNEIKQDFEEVEEEDSIIININKREVSLKEKGSIWVNQDEQKQCLQIEKQCEKLKQQIFSFKEEIFKRELRKQEESMYQQLIKVIQANNQILRNQQTQQIDFFQTKIGKDSFFIQHLNGSQDFQQKLIEEIQKLKIIINMSSIDVLKLKRQTKRNEQILPFEQENKEQFYQKYKKLKKQVDEKREKYENQQQKQLQLQLKLQKLRQKYGQMQSSMTRIPDLDKRWQQQQKIVIKYQQLIKRRDVQIKKNTILMHQIQNNCQITARNVLDLRKQNSQMQDKINGLQEKNNIVEEDSSKLMQKFEAKRQKVKVRSIQKVLQSNDSSRLSPNELKPILPLSNRIKYNSQTKNSFITNIFDNNVPQGMQISSHERYMPKRIVKIDKMLQTKNDNDNIFKIGLGQSSTSNTLKQFKLKLPSHSTQKSTKNLNISLDINKNTPNKQKGKNDQSKLSITQRLERIQLLQRQDRIYSHTFNEMKRQDEERNSNSSLKNQQSLNNQLPNHLKQCSKQDKAIILSLAASKTENSMPQAYKITRESLQIRADIVQIPKISANQTFNSTQQNQQASSVPHLTDRLHHKYFKKRIIYRQKKISQDYMKVLEQRGRKILQLDNQSEA